MYTEAQTRFFHSPAIMIREANLALIRSITAKPGLQINVANHPLPRTQEVFQVNGLISGINVIFVVSIGFSFLFAGIISAVVRERQSGSKDIQLQSGLTSLTYWLSHFLLDYLKYLIVAVFTLIFIWVFDVEALLTLGRIEAMVLLVFLYGLTVLPCLYLLSFLFKEYGNAENGAFIFNILACSFLPILFLSFSAFSESSR